MAAASMNFSNVFLGGKDRALGELRVHDAGFTWRSKLSSKLITVPPSDITGLSWARVRGGHQLRANLKGGANVKFEGLKGADLDALRGICKSNFGKDIGQGEISTKGLSWGAVSVDGAVVRFSVEDKEAFEIPLSEVAQATIQGKNEVALELHVADTLAPEDEMVTEIRFLVPPKGLADDVDAEDADGTRAETADAFLNEVISRADLAISGDTIASLNDVPMAVPRGRYEIEFYASFLKLHGKTYDYKVMYSSIVSLYRLPKPDQYHVNVAVHLEPAIRQGATFYQFLLMQFPAEEEMDVSVDLPPAVLADKYGGRLESRLSGTTHSVVADLVRGLADKPLHEPSPDFRSAQGFSAIKCALKADEGYLFGFDKAFMFVNKPTTLVTFDSIATVEFARVEKNASGKAVSQSFDMVVYRKSGDQVAFSNLKRNEYQGLFKFLVAKKIRIKNIHKGASGLDVGDDVDGPSGKRGAEEMDLSGDEEEEEDDDSEEEDDDFQAGDESSVDEEYMEEGCSDDEEAVMAKGAKGKAKAAKGGESASGGGSESESDDGGAKAAKQAAKEAKAAKQAKKAAKAAKKAKKDPDEPKRPLGAYFLFSNATRSALKEEHPQLSFTELGKLLGERWKEASPEVRAEYEDQAKQAKADYDAAMKAYRAKKAAEKAEAEVAEEEEEDDGEQAGGVMDSDGE